MINDNEGCHEMHYDSETGWPLLHKMACSRRFFDSLRNRMNLNKVIRKIWCHRPPGTDGNTHLFSSGMRRGAVLVAFAAILLESCGSTAKTSTEANSASSAPYVLHAELSETGVTSELGGREGEALRLLVKEVDATGGIDHRKVVLDLKDNQSNASLAVSLATPWVRNGNPIVIDGSSATTDTPVDELAGSTGPVMFDTSPVGVTQPGGFVFHSGDSLTNQIKAQLTYAESRGWTNIASITSDDSSGTAAATSLSNLIKTPQYSKFKYLTHQVYQDSATTVSSQLSVIKATHPQVIFTWGVGTVIGTVFAGLSELGMSSIPVLVPSADASYTLFKRFASVDPKSIYVPLGTDYLPPTEAPAQLKGVLTTFDKLVKSQGGHPGDPWALSYAAGQLAIDALKHLGLGASAVQIRNYLEHVTNIPTVFGLVTMTYSEHRIASSSEIYVMDWTGSALTKVSGAGG